MVKTTIEDDDYKVTVQADRNGGLLCIFNKNNPEDYNTIRYNIDKNGEAFMKFTFDPTRTELTRYVVLLHDYVHCDGQFLPRTNECRQDSYRSSYGVCDCE